MRFNDVIDPAPPTTRPGHTPPITYISGIYVNGKVLSRYQCSKVSYDDLEEIVKSKDVYFIVSRTDSIDESSLERMTNSAISEPMPYAQLIIRYIDQQNTQPN